MADLPKWSKDIGVKNQIPSLLCWLKICFIEGDSVWWPGYIPLGGLSYYLNCLALFHIFNPPASLFDSAYA